MVKIEKILVPVDFSTNSQKAAKYGLAIAKDRKAKVYFVHVISQKIIEALHELSVKGYKGDFVEIMKEVTKERENELKTLVPSDWYEGVDAEFLIKQGKPSTVIIQLAKELNIDLIVVGYQGRSALGDFLLGSVAHYVVNHATCPVLVIHPGEKEIL